MMETFEHDEPCRSCDRIPCACAPKRRSPRQIWNEALAEKWLDDNVPDSLHLVKPLALLLEEVMALAKTPQEPPPKGVSPTVQGEEE